MNGAGLAGLPSTLALAGSAGVLGAWTGSGPVPGVMPGYSVR
jgi:hypothetical protein